jgi:hypothetical protein
MTAILDSINSFYNEACHSAKEVYSYISSFNEETPAPDNAIFSKLTPKKVYEKASLLVTAGPKVITPEGRALHAAGHALKLLSFTGGCLSIAPAAKVLFGFSTYPIITTAILMASGVVIHDIYQIGSECTKNSLQLSWEGSLSKSITGENVAQAVKNTITYQLVSALNEKNL